MPAVHEDIADHRLYSVYWKLILEDACEKMGMPPTRDNKARLHEAHKKILGYDSIAGKSQEFLSMFIFEVVCWYAVELGIFLRTNKNQPEGIENMDLEDVWHVL